MESLCLKSVASNKGLKLTAHGGGPVGRGAPQLNPVFGGHNGGIA
jgi:hypothetical protein